MGGSFSNNATVATVKSHNSIDGTVWLRETNTNIDAASIRLYIDPNKEGTNTTDLKVGDKVEVIDTSGCSGYLGKLGEIGVVIYIDYNTSDNPKYDLVETSLVKGRMMHRNRFKKVEDTNETLRKELSNAIDLIVKYRILPSEAFNKQFYIGDIQGRYTKEELLEILLPPAKTPKQLEVERIEEEMRKLADDLAKLNQEN